MKKKGLSHLDAKGRISMVDVSRKPVSRRTATAEAVIVMKDETFKLISSGGTEKGDVFAAARLAGIQAAKKTPDLIPLCHPLLLGKVELLFSHRRGTKGKTALQILSSVTGEGQTGLEMEAMVSASVAALTVYDMCKSIDRWMTVSTVRLFSKEGGKSGSLRRPGLKSSLRNGR